MADYKYPLRVDEDLVQRARQKAQDEGVDLSQVLRQFIKMYVAGTIGMADLLTAGKEASSARSGIPAAPG